METENWYRTSCEGQVLFLSKKIKETRMLGSAHCLPPLDSSGSDHQLLTKWDPHPLKPLTCKGGAGRGFGT